MPTSAASRSRWAGISPEDRRAERRGLFIDAAFDLLGSEGTSATTVRAVCQRARLNPRYFYESFADLDALLLAVYDRVVAAMRSEVDAAMAAAGPDREAQTRAAVARLVSFVDEDRRRARVLYVEALGNEALNRRRIETGHSVVEALERYTAERRRGAPAGERVGLIAAAVVVGGLSELLVAWLDGRIPVSRARLVDDATAVLLGVGDTAADIARSRRRLVR